MTFVVDSLALTFVVESLAMTFVVDSLALTLQRRVHQLPGVFLARA